MYSCMNTADERKKKKVVYKRSTKWDKRRGLGVSEGWGGGVGGGVCGGGGGLKYNAR